VELIACTLQEGLLMQKPYSFLDELLTETAHRLPEKEGVVFNEQRFTWHEFNQRVDNLARAFLEYGVQRGDRIGVISTTRPEYLCVYMACARIGAMMVGFNILYTIPELTRLMTLSTPKIMVVLDKNRDKSVAAALMPIFATMSFIEQIVVIGDAIPENALSLNQMMHAERRHLDDAIQMRRLEMDTEDGVLVVFTSGSTGVPKAAVLNHRCILSTILVQVRDLDYQMDDRVLQNKPMNHVGGTTNQTMPSIAVGATLVFMDHFHPVKVLEIIQRERISFLGQVPTMFIMELNLTTFQDYDLSSVRLAAVSGAATPIPIMYKIMDMAEKVITGYGMTETGGYITYTKPNDDPEWIATTVGAIAPEFELRVTDDNRCPVPVGTVGEVAIRGKCLFKEYLGNPIATDETRDAEGWFYSGDMGYLNEHGYLTLVDRKKDMYISGGYNVYPREIEQHISQHPKVALVAVIGMADTIMGEVGVACVTPLPDSEITPEAIRQHCIEGLAEYKIPRLILIQPSLPLTPLGKIDKPQLRRNLLEKGLMSE
jgi:fatty-acyl-CoA synthase